ncbi:hypothetical protein N9971_00855, partial [bacterium]|nr:hypothetical protein [bacterium]
FPEMLTARRLGALGCALFVSACLLPAMAQETPDAYLELLRQDVRAMKSDILDEALDLTEEQATAFWPIYKEYETEMTAYGDRRIEIIERFIDNWGAIDDTEADGFAKDFFSLQTDRIKILKSYYKKVAKATSPLVAARFVQAENVIGKMIDLQIVTELPLIE